MRAELERLEREWAILHKAWAIYSREPLPLHLTGTGQPCRYALCMVLQVAPSRYYAWRQRRSQLAPAWERAVVRVFARYGTRRLRAEVQADGHRVGCWRIRRVLQAHGLRAQQPCSFGPRLALPDQLAGRLLAQMVGWDVRETMPEDPVSEALRRPPAGLLVHSDQGSQYGYALSGTADSTRSHPEHEPARQLL